MDGQTQRIQLVSADGGMALGHRIQIVTDQQTGQKIQIVTAFDQAPAGRQQFILAKQEPSPGKVILTTPDGNAVNQLLFTSPDLAGQQIQFVTDGWLGPVTCQTCCGVLRGVWRQGLRASLRSGELRGVQGLLQAECQEEPGVHLQGDGGVRNQQAPSQSLPVLPPAALYFLRHEAGLCSVRAKACGGVPGKSPPLAATPTFVTDKETARSTSLLESGMLLNIQQPFHKLENIMLPIIPREDIP
ncbi:hypothetical protein SKAU_G00023060 [Synaphobranchus kaupii]|uniref:Uncharacterized protein n=1 Tax=Synaphobranchus kaupii TaxID=118154 RepID=A0A9Q1GDE8_SYNKA|nr:hypothetical protein SKAU_G00023060 [Synaphobranchus kaupii]